MRRETDKKRFERETKEREAFLREHPIQVAEDLRALVHAAINDPEWYGNTTVDPVTRLVITTHLESLIDNFETILFHQMEQIIKQFEKHGIKAKRQLTSTKDSAN